MMISTPFDINEAHALGVDSFVREFQLLVSEPEFEALVEAVYGIFSRSESIPDRDIMDAVIVDYRYLFYITQVLHFDVCITRLGSRWSSSSMSSAVKKYFFPDWKMKASSYGIFGYPVGRSERIKNILRTYRNTYQNNPNRTRLDRLFPHYGGDQHTIVLGPLCSLGTTSEGGDDFQVFTDIYPEDISISTRGIDHNFSRRATSQLIDPLRYRVQRVAKQLSVHAPRSELLDVLLSRLEIVNARIKVFSFHFDQSRFRKARRFRTIGNSRPLRKLAAVSAHHLGLPVEMLTHGFEFANYRSKIEVRARYSGATEFVLPNQYLASRYHDLYANDPALKYLPVKFVSARPSITGGTPEVPNSLSKVAADFDVMIIGYPMNWFRYLSYPGNYWYIQLNLQYRLAQMLHDRGFSVVYKCHPDRKGPWLDMFRSVVDHVDGGNIGASSAQYDVETYLFTGTFSTAFGFAAKTRNRMILVDHPDVCYTDSGRELIESRCSIVPTELGEHGQVEFCDERLFAALQDCPKEPGAFRDLL